MIFSQKTTIILLLALQLIFIFIIFQSFAVHYAYLHIVFSTVAIVLAIYILNSSENPAYKLAWIVPLVIALYNTQKSVLHTKGQKPLC